MARIPERVLLRVVGMDVNYQFHTCLCRLRHGTSVLVSQGERSGDLKKTQERANHLILEMLHSEAGEPLSATAKMVDEKTVSIGFGDKFRVEPNSA